MNIFEYDFIYIALAISTILLYIYYKKVSPDNYWKARNVPHIPPSSVIVNIIAMGWFVMRKSIPLFYQELCNQFEGHRFFGIFDFSKPSIIVRDKELCEQILIKDFSSFHDRDLKADTEYEPLSGTLVNIEGRQWKNLRSKLTPTFTSGKLKSMFDQINNCAEELIKFIDQRLPDANPFDAKLLTGRFTTNVIASCAFGLQFDTTNDEISEFQIMANKAFSSSKLSTLRVILRVLFPKLSKMLNVKFMPHDAERYFINLVRETLKQRKESGIARADFLQMLLSLQEQEENGKNMNVNRNRGREEYSEEDKIINQMQYDASEYANASEKQEKLFTDKCVAAQAFTFLAAGGEAVSGSISVLLYAIAEHSHVQNRIHSEIDNVLKKHEGKWSYEAVKDMTYLDLVMQEAFRMYPVVPVINRKCTKAFKIPDTNVVIEPGTQIALPVYALHKDPRYYKNPEVFEPERFTGNNFKPSGCFMPFGDGPRICIAMRFAVLELKVCAAKLLSNYHITINKKTSVPMKFKRGSMMLEPEEGTWLDFHSRKL